MIRRLSFMTCVLAAAAVFVAGGGISSGKSASKGVIVIGAPISITGALQPWGKWDLEMAQLAVNDINSSGGVLGGRKLKFAIVDDKSDFAANGASAALQTIQDGAKVIVTDCDSGWGAPAQTAAESKGVGSLSWCAGAPQFGVKGGLGALTSSGGIATANEAAVPAEWGYKTQKWRKAYLLNDPSLAYDTTYCSMFRKRFQQLGGAIVGQDQFQQTDSSIATQITRLRATKPAPDVIVLCSVPPGGATAVRQLRAAGINTTLMMSDGMAGNDWLPSVPGLTNAFLSTYAAQDGTDPIAKINQLTKRWRTTYHSAVPIPDVYNAYADIQLIAAAINKAGSDQPKAIALALASTNNVDTVLGKHTFEPGYNLSFTSAVAIIKIAQKKDTFEARQRPEIDAVKLLGK